MAKRNGRELVVANGISLTATGMRLPDTLTEKQWLDVGEQLRLCDGALGWAVGDWWAYGEDSNYGRVEKAKDDHGDICGMSVGHVKNCGMVARAFELSHRCDNLTFNHHLQVMTIKGNGDTREERSADALPKRLAWLERAEEGNENGKWSAQELRRQLRQERLRLLLAAETDSTGGTAEVEQADCIDWLERQEPFDLLLTDPPYMTDVPDIGGFASEWMPLALSRIKPTGRAYIFVGAYPDEMLAYLSAHRGDMVLANILVWSYTNTLGPQPTHDYIQNYQSVLYFRGPKAPPLNNEVLLEQVSCHNIAHPARSGDNYHKWEKPINLAQMFIRHATEPGQVVADPFVCTGTFPLAAASLGRVGIGCDCSDENLNFALERGCDLKD